MEDQTLNPFRMPKVGGQVPRRLSEVEPEPALPVWMFRELPICVSLLAIVLVAYWGVWNFDFVYFDDPGYVTDNLDVKRGLPLFTNFKVFCESICWAFTAFVQSNWHPLTWLSHMLDVQLYGLEAGGHHVTNIIFHVSNTVLLFWLLRWVTGRNWPSAAVAALFAVHPMHVESVVWIAERKDVLSTFLGLSTLLAYVYYTKKPGVSRYIPVFLLLALGLLAKPMLVTFPCVCLLLDFWPLRRLNLFGEADAPVRRVAAADRPYVPRRRAKRNQRLPTAARPPQIRDTAQRPVGFVGQFIRLVVEKLPLFALSAFSMAITPYAQNHGGSMASASELSFAFRFENSLQSYLTYICRMFYPGKMSVLYLLDIDHVNHLYTAVAAVVMLVTTGLVIWAAFHGRRYLALGWFWYVGTLVPVIGIVQVGEQSHADRYTYIPYIGLFIMLAWGIAELIDLLPEARTVFRYMTSYVMIFALVTCVVWTKYQLQFWTDVETHLRHALTITPDNWNMLNNLGVKLWKKGQEQDGFASKAEAEGDSETAQKFHLKAVEFKDDAKAQWIHGITARPTATDIHSNLGYAYSEANDLDKAEWHLNRAVELKPISPRPRNNLGRVLLRRSQQLEADAREAEAKGKTDPAQAAKVPELRNLAKIKLNAAIEQFIEAVRLDPTLLEARLNLGEVYLQLNELDKAEEQYRAIVNFRSESEKDQETLNNYSQGWYCLARIAIARKNPEEAVDVDLPNALALNVKNVAAMQMMVDQKFRLGKYEEGEKYLWAMLAVLPKMQRRSMAEQFGRQLEAGGKIKEAVRAYNFLAWAFATSPEPQILDPEAALVFAQRVAVAMTQQQDPRSMDTLAAALAANGRFREAVQVAQTAINLANSQGNKPLAEAISRRLQSYQQEKPYRCDPTGSDRP